MRERGQTPFAGLGYDPVLVVDHVGCSHVEVVDHSLLDLGVEVSAPYSGEHVLEPGVFFCAGDDEWSMAHTKSGVSPLVGICGWPTEVLLEKQHHVFARLSEVVGIHRAEQKVGFDRVVEAVDHLLEPGGSADCFEDRYRFHERQVRAVRSGTVGPGYP